MVGTRVTVQSSAATAILSSQGAGVVRRVNVRNRGSVSVDLGGSTITSGNGFELQSGESLSFEIGSGESLYGIAASGTCRVDVLTEVRT